MVYKQITLIIEVIVSLELKGGGANGVVDATSYFHTC